MKKSNIFLNKPLQNQSNIGSVFPILRSTNLPHFPKGMISLLKNTSGLSLSVFEKLYTELLENFTEFAQYLPSTPQGKLGSLLQEGLARALLILMRYSNNNRPQFTRFFYALFTAALLKNLGSVVFTHRVLLTDEIGNYIEDWNPFNGALSTSMNHVKAYRLLPLSVEYARHVGKATLLLARQLLPQSGYDWIVEDKLLFSFWLAALMGEESHEEDTLPYILSLISEEVLVQYLEHFDMDIVVLKEAVDSSHGIAFFHWIKKLLSQKAATTLSSSGVHLIQEGLFLEFEKLFRSFSEIYNKPVSLTVVQAQFGNLMGLVKKGGYDFMNAQYFSETPQNSVFSARRKIVQGILLPDNGATLGLSIACEKSKALLPSTQGEAVQLASPSMNPVNKTHL